MDGKAARRFRLDGKLYRKGWSISLPDAQFEDLRRAGLVEYPPPAKTRRTKAPPAA